MHLTLYITAGFPDLESTQRILDVIEDYPVKAVELGVPYSDPLADGEAIQQASQEALENGISLSSIMGAKLKSTKDVYLMGYFNTFYKYGFEGLLQGMQEQGMKGTIIPDLPDAYFDAHLKSEFERFGIGQSFLVTPESSDERIQLLAQKSGHFLYAVSRSATTGGTFAFNESTSAYLDRLEQLGVKEKTRVGFGISDKASAQPYFDKGWNVIVGSAFVKAVKANGVDGARKFLDSFYS